MTTEEAKSILNRYLDWYENRNNYPIETYRPFDSSIAPAIKAALACMENHVPEGGEK